MSENTVEQTQNIELEAIYEEFGDIEVATTKLHESNNAICSEIGGCHLGTNGY
ncbi:hypothetical protein ACTWOG_005403 [Serratia marcescens]